MVTLINGKYNNEWKFVFIIDIYASLILHNSLTHSAFLFMVGIFYSRKFSTYSSCCCCCCQPSANSSLSLSLLDFSYKFIFREKEKVSKNDDDVSWVWEKESENVSFSRVFEWKMENFRFSRNISKVFHDEQKEKVQKWHL